MGIFSSSLVPFWSPLQSFLSDVIQACQIPVHTHPSNGTSKTEHLSHVFPGNEAKGTHNSFQHSLQVGLLLSHFHEDLYVWIPYMKFFMFFLWSFLCMCPFHSPFLRQVLLYLHFQVPVCWLLASLHPALPRPWSCHNCNYGVCIIPSVVSGSPSRQSCSMRNAVLVLTHAGPWQVAGWEVTPGYTVMQSPWLPPSRGSDPPWHLECRF